MTLKPLLFKVLDDGCVYGGGMTTQIQQKLLESLGPEVRVLGVMGGTSMDGLDLAMLSFAGESFTVLDATDYLEFTKAEFAILSEAMGRRSDERAESVITQAHITAVRSWLNSDRPKPDVIGFHGQTLLHDPGQRLTVQVGDPQALADAVGIPVVANLRLHDVSLGGQGAPLVPVYHQARLGTVAEPTVILNIGGVSNITYVGTGGALVAFDTGPGNAPLNDWAQEHLGEPMDRDGALAAKGKVARQIVEDFLALPFFDQAPPKSLDRDSFPIQALVRHLSPADGAATLVSMTIESIAAALKWLPEVPGAWFITGGGRQNPVLMRALSERLAVPAYPVEQLGWNGDMLEAEAFAYLAMCHLWGKPITFPTTTGATSPQSGGELFLPDVE